MKKLTNPTTKEQTKQEQTSLNQNNCTFHVMPSQISDQDIQSLFLGLVKVVKKKYELDTKSEILNLSLTQEELIKQLNEKTAECNRLKNEIIYLKSQL